MFRPNPAWPGPSPPQLVRIRTPPGQDDDATAGISNGVFVRTAHFPVPNPVPRNYCPRCGTWQPVPPGPLPWVYNPYPVPAGKHRHLMVYCLACGILYEWRCSTSWCDEHVHIVREYSVVEPTSVKANLRLWVGRDPGGLINDYISSARMGMPMFESLRTLEDVLPKLVITVGCAWTVATFGTVCVPTECTWTGKFAGNSDLAEVKAGSFGRSARSFGRSAGYFRSLFFITGRDYSGDNERNHYRYTASPRSRRQPLRSNNPNAIFLVFTDA